MEEVQDCKKKIKTLEDQNAYLKKEVFELNERVREQERYKMRWCLRIKGMEEKVMCKCDSNSPENSPRSQGKNGRSGGHSSQAWKEN